MSKIRGLRTFITVSLHKVIGSFIIKNLQIYIFNKLTLFWIA